MNNDIIFFKEVVFLDLNKKVAFVTGASIGLGKGLIEELSKNGCNVIIGYNKSKEKAEWLKKYIEENKRDFPYLGGNKICNYWLYVMEKYTDVSFTDRENITVAPDTHVIQASARLGIISPEEIKSSDVQLIVVQRWKELLEGTEWVPIDIHTPMWLWSRGKFQVEL